MTTRSLDLIQIAIGGTQYLIRGVASAALEGLSVLISPVREITLYVFPILSNYTFLTKVYTSVDEHTEDGEIDLPSKKTLYNRVRLLQQQAGLSRELQICTKIDCVFSSAGGPLSFGKPVLNIPTNQISNPFVKNPLFHFTDREKDFLMMRQIEHIKGNYAARKAVLKIALTALIFFAFTFTGSHLAVGGVFLIGLGIITLYQRRVEKLLDRKAMKSLGLDGAHVALQTLEKIQKQNIALRKNSWLQKIIFTKTGEERFNFSSPSLKTRIQIAKNSAC